MVSRKTRLANLEQKRSAARANPSIVRTPAAVLRGAQQIEADFAKHGGLINVAVPTNGYDLLDKFEMRGNTVEIGKVGNARPSLIAKDAKRFFQFAGLLGSAASYETHRFDMSTERLEPITAHNNPRRRNVYLTYAPGGTISYGQMIRGAYPQGLTTGETALEPHDPSLSLVLTDASIKPHELKMTAGTEINQSQISIHGITLASGRNFTNLYAAMPYQETIANAAGNMLGAIASGWTYEGYLDYLKDVYDPGAALHGNKLKQPFGLRDFTLVVPHLMFEKQTYEQLADGQEIIDMPILVPRQPRKS